MTNQNYSDALEFLSKFNGRTMNRLNGHHHKVMNELLSLFGIDLTEFDFIQITGSCGKGSTAHFISSILSYHSIKHGLFTGPHLNHYEERFKCNGHEIEHDIFASIVLDIQESFKQFHNESEVGHMHVMILIALVYFKKKGIKLVIFENGVGGKTDPSNIIDPLIAVITEITLDHSHLLGSTIEDIIIDKSCIIKSTTQYVICGMNNIQARNYLLKIEAHDEANFLFVNRDYGYLLRKADNTGSLFHYKGRQLKLENQTLQILGAHQVQNASNALAVIEALIQIGYQFNVTMIEKALSRIQIDCRMEIVTKQDTTFLLDGAHNVLELKTLKKNLQLIDLKISHVILSISSNKNIDRMLQAIEMEDVDYIITPHPFLERNSSQESIKDTIQNFDSNRYTYQLDVHNVLNDLIQKTDKQSVILVTGSLYLVGYVKELLLKTEQNSSEGEK